MLGFCCQHFEYHVALLHDHREFNYGNYCNNKPSIFCCSTFRASSDQLNYWRFEKDQLINLLTTATRIAAKVANFLLDLNYFLC